MSGMAQRILATPGTHAHIAAAAAADDEAHGAAREIRVGDKSCFSRYSYCLARNGQSEIERNSAGGTQMRHDGRSHSDFTHNSSDSDAEGKFEYEVIWRFPYFCHFFTMLVY